jgi:hypothetical protein
VLAKGAILLGTKVGREEAVFTYISFPVASEGPFSLKEVMARLRGSRDVRADTSR